MRKPCTKCYLDPLPEVTGYPCIGRLLLIVVILGIVEEKRKEICAIKAKQQTNRPW